MYKRQRCYFSTWGLPQPDWPKDYPDYAGSSICTTQDFVDVLQANQDSFVVKPRRLLLQNEPWVGAVQPKSGTELADFYKNELEPALAIVPMNVVLHTSKKSEKCLTVDVEFLKRCDDIGCNFDLATEWSLHHYSQETQEWIDYYTWDTGEWYTDRYAAFAGGYGTRTEQEWKDLLRKFTFLVTETNANWEFTNPIPTNEEYCERVTGQQDTISPGYGIGGIQWALQQDHITGLINWPLWWEWFEGRPAGAAERALSGRLLYNDGTWTPAGKAWLALNDPAAQAAVDCGHDKSPSPPPALALSPPPASPPYAPHGCAAWDALGFATRTDLTSLQNVDGSHLTACPQLKQNQALEASLQAEADANCCGNQGGDPLLSCRDPPEGTGACSDWCSNYYFTDLATGGLRVCIANPSGNQCKNTDPVDVCPPSPPPPGFPTLIPDDAGTPSDAALCDNLIYHGSTLAPAGLDSHYPGPYSGNKDQEGGSCYARTNSQNGYSAGRYGLSLIHI